MKVLISGGHLTPALAVIDYIQAYHPEIDIEFVGRMYAQQLAKQKAHEKREIEARHIVFHPFMATRSDSRQIWKKIIFPFEFIKSFFSALLLIIKVKPDIFLSFGSYLSVPLAYACWVVRVPIIIHEQTRVIGRATRVLAPVANYIAVSFEETAKTLPRKKTLVTGNPVRAAFKKKVTKKPDWLSKKTQPILYVTGGSQGSEIINTTICGSIRQLVKQFTVIHQCGLPNAHRNYKQELELIRKKLPGTQKQEYYIREWISDDELAWILSNADCAISRSGANTVAELQLKCVPTIFIPLPFSLQNEQFINAAALKKEQAAVILEQKNLSPKTLITSLKKLTAKRKKIVSQLKKMPLPQDADQKLVELLMKTSTRS